eukprot:2983377-Amphidinium_carterae.1
MFLTDPPREVCARSFLRVVFSRAVVGNGEHSSARALSYSAVTELCAELYVIAVGLICDQTMSCKYCFALSCATHTSA